MFVDLALRRNVSELGPEICLWPAPYVSCGPDSGRERTSVECTTSGVCRTSSTQPQRCQVTAAVLGFLTLSWARRHPA